MGIVIPFEVVRQDKPDTEAELRIQEKEAIYRELIEKEARKYGISFLEAEAYENEKYRILDTEEEADGEATLYEIRAKKNGTSLYEASLDVRIGFLQNLNKYAPDFRCPTRLNHD